MRRRTARLTDGQERVLLALTTPVAGLEWGEADRDHFGIEEGWHDRYDLERVSGVPPAKMAATLRALLGKGFVEAKTVKGWEHRVDAVGRVISPQTYKLTDLGRAEVSG